MVNKNNNSSINKNVTQDETSTTASAVESSNTHLKGTEAQTGTDSPTVFDTTKWVEEDVNLDNGGFSFKHPSTFTSFAKCTNTPWVYARSESNNTNIGFNDKNAEAKETECFGFGDTIIFSIEEFDGQGNSKSRGVSAPTKLVGDASSVTIDGIKGEKICVKENSQAIAGGPIVITQCQYNATTTDSQLWISYSILEGAVTNELDNVMDTLASTVVFTNLIR